LEEDQTSEQFIGYMLLWFQRFMDRRNFKAKYKNLIDGLNNQLKTYFSNIDGSKPKDKELAD